MRSHLVLVGILSVAFNVATAGETLENPRPVDVEREIARRRDLGKDEIKSTDYQNLDKTPARTLKAGATFNIDVQALLTRGGGAVKMKNNTEPLKEKDLPKVVFGSIYKVEKGLDEFCANDMRLGTVSSSSFTTQSSVPIASTATSRRLGDPRTLSKLNLPADRHFEAETNAYSWHSDWIDALNSQYLIYNNCLQHIEDTMCKVDSKPLLDKNKKPVFERTSKSFPIAAPKSERTVKNCNPEWVTRVKSSLIEAMKRNDSTRGQPYCTLWYGKAFDQDIKLDSNISLKLAQDVILTPGASKFDFKFTDKTWESMECIATDAIADIQKLLQIKDSTQFLHSDFAGVDPNQNDPGVVSFSKLKKDETPPPVVVPQTHSPQGQRNQVQQNNNKGKTKYSMDPN